MLWMKQWSAVKQWWCRCCSLAPNSRSLEAEFPSLWQKFTDGFWSPSALGMAGQGLCSWSSRDCCCIGSYILTLIAALFSLAQDEVNIGKFYDLRNFSIWQMKWHFRSLCITYWLMPHTKQRLTAQRFLLPHRLLASCTWYSQLCLFAVLLIFYTFTQKWMNEIAPPTKRLNFVSSCSLYFIGETNNKHMHYCGFN